MTATTMPGWPGMWAKAQRWEAVREHWARGAGDETRRGGRHHGLRGPWGMGGPGFGFPWAGPGRPRPRRGDVRFAVLRLLSEQPMHGYQIITELTERSGGVWRPSPGSVYPTLQQLEDEGLVTASEQEGRRTFSLTEAGRAEVERAAVGRSDPWDDLADEAGEAAKGLRWSAVQVMRAVMQVAMTGDDRVAAGAERLLNDTRRALYRLLAEAGEPDGEEEQ